MVAGRSPHTRNASTHSGSVASQHTITTGEAEEDETFFSISFLSSLPASELESKAEVIATHFHRVTASEHLAAGNTAQLPPPEIIEMIRSVEELNEALRCLWTWVQKLHTSVRLGLQQSAVLCASVLQQVAACVDNGGASESEALERHLVSAPHISPSAVADTIADILETGLIRHSMHLDAADRFLDFVVSACSCALLKAPAILGCARIMSLLCQLLQWSDVDCPPTPRFGRLTRAHQVPGGEERRPIINVHLFMIQRRAATAIINLFRGNRENKAAALSLSLQVAESKNRTASHRPGGQPQSSSVLRVLHRVIVATSDDYYFQLQCLEILFRLYVFDRATFSAAAPAAGIDSVMLSGLSRVRNDANVLQSLEQLLVETLELNHRIVTQVDPALSNSTKDTDPEGENSATVVALDTVRVELQWTTSQSVKGGATVPLSGPTVLYFNPRYLVFMPSAQGSGPSSPTAQQQPLPPGEPVTVLFEDIVSMRLRDRRVSLQVQTIGSSPSCLAPILLSTALPPPTTPLVPATTMTLLVHLTETALREHLRNGVIHQWIVASKPRQTPKIPQQDIHRRSASPKGNQADERHSDANSSKPRAGGSSNSRVRPRSSSAVQSREDDVMPPPPPVPPQTAATSRPAAPRSALTSPAAIQQSKKAILEAVTLEVQQLVDSYRDACAKDRESFERLSVQSVSQYQTAIQEIKSDAQQAVLQLNDGLVKLRKEFREILHDIDALVGWCEGSSAPTLKQSESTLLLQLKDLVDAELGALHELLVKNASDYDVDETIASVLMQQS